MGTGDQERFNDRKHIQGSVTSPSLKKLYRPRRNENPWRRTSNTLRVPTARLYGYLH